MIRNGMDLVEIERIRRSLESPAFLQKVFGEHERAAFSHNGLRAESAAGAFAAKEAFSKKQTTYPADISKRPPKKEPLPPKKFSESQDTHKSEGRVHETQTVLTSVRLVDRQKKRVRVQKTHLKKRA